MKNLKFLPLFFFTACAFVPDEEMRGDTAAPVGPVSSPSSTFRVEALEEIGRYAVVFSADAALPCEMRRQDPEGLVHVIGYRDTTQGLRDDDVRSGESYTYSCGGDSFVVRIPEDRILEGAVELKSDLRIDGRLALSRGSKISIPAGMNFTLQADTLLSPEAEILAPSATLSLKLREARGKLSLSLRGFDGLAGRDGQRPAKYPGAAAQGSPAATEKVVTESGRLGYHESTVCSAQPGNGHNGARGHAGENGGNGGDGTAGGRLLVLIERSSDLKLDYSVEGGTGGRGGRGSAGGEGQEGGAPGAMRSPCNPARSGERGPDGFAGKNGEDGKAGVAGEACVILGPKREGACDKVVDLIGRLSEGA
jgi:hypothetical protein